MKHILTLAIVLTSATAFATRARVTALGNSPHIIDTALSAPDQLLPLSDSLTIESGTTSGAAGVLTNLTPAANATSTVTTNAEGSIYKTMGDGKLGLVLGHQDATVYRLRKVAANAIATIDAQQNPVNLSYSMRLADLNAGFGLIYSNYENKTAAPADEKESSMGVQAGVSSSVFYANAKLIFTDSYKTSAVEYKGNLGVDLKAGYYFDDLSVHANIYSGGFKTSNTTTDTSDVTLMNWSLKLVDTIKKDSNFFYGVGLASSTVKESKNTPNSKIETMSLPLIIGLETPALSWLTFRGSVTQDVIISNSKSEGTVFGAATETAPGVNTTTFAAGAGLVFNKVTLDGSILAAGTQNLDAGNLLGTVGLTYNF